MNASVRIEAAASLLMLLLAAGARADPPAPATVPVLVELFTSEGCSSCPPADAALARLVRTQPVPGIEVIGLAEHVDYWDSSDWRDAFSSHDFTLRQEQYSERIGGGRIYTPQAIVGGQVDVLGSNEPRLRRALADLRSRPRGAIALRETARDDSAIAIHVDVEALPAHGGADVMVAVVEDDVVSKVTGGENRGRTLQHVAVVRSLTRLGQAAGASWHGDQRLALEPAWRRGSIRLVGFVQESGTGRILIAGTGRPAR